LSTSQKQVSEFLGELKKLIAQKRFFFVPRLETNKSVLSLGLTIENAIQELLNLSVINYSAGPQQDRNMSSENIWIFGKEINGCEVYIKLKIFSVNGIQYGKCISFHEAEFAMKYPFPP